MATINLSSAENDMVDTLLNKLGGHRVGNTAIAKKYNGTHIPEAYNIALPPRFQNLHAVLGWYGIVIDTLEERLDMVGFNDPHELGVMDMYIDNDLGVESSLVHHDALLYGTGFVLVGAGYDGEPNPLITVESPNTMTGVWDRRLRRLSAALNHVDDETLTLYSPDATIEVRKSSASGRWLAASRDDHGLGRVPVVRFDNRLRSTQSGKSEISPAVSYLSDAAARTAIRMEVTSELYQAPKEVILGGDRDLLLDEKGEPISQWTSYLGRTRQIPWSNDDEQRATPEIEQLDPVDPKPFLDQIAMFGVQLSSQAGFPSYYLGNTVNSAQTADAIVAGEVRLVKRAERRQTIFGRQWREVARLGLMIRYGRDVDEEAFKEVSPLWMDASTPTRAATTDAVVKLVQSGIIPADSAVVSDELNLTPAQRRTLARERTQSRAGSMLDALLNRAPEAVESAAPAEPESEEI